MEPYYAGSTQLHGREIRTYGLYAELHALTFMGKVVVVNPIGFASAHHAPEHNAIQSMGTCISREDRQDAKDRKPVRGHQQPITGSKIRHSSCQ